MIKLRTQFLPLLTALIFSGFVNAQTWTSPVPVGSTIVSGTGYYAYNVGAGGFLDRGGEWATQAILFTAEGSLVTPVFDSASSLWTIQFESASRLLFCSDILGNMFTDGTSNNGTTSNTQFTLTGPATDNTYSIQVRSTFTPYDANLFVGSGNSAVTAPNGGKALVYQIKYNTPSSDYTKWIFCTADEVAKYNAKLKLNNYMKIAQLVGSSLSLTNYITCYNDSSSAEILAAATRLNTALNPTDKTSSIVNPGFYDGANSYTGWTTTVSTSANYSEVEYWQKIGGINQTISSLPAGIYTMKVQGFERPLNLSATDETWYANGWDSRGAYFYATVSGDTTTCPFRSMYSEKSSTSGITYSGGTIIYPNNMAQAQTGFVAGLYDNELPYFTVDATGIATIGLNACYKKNTTTYTQSQWLIADNFRLYYYGPVSGGAITGIDATQQPEFKVIGAKGIIRIYADQATVQIYSASGSYLRNVIVSGSKTVDLNAGIYIIKAGKTLAKAVVL